MATFLGFLLLDCAALVGAGHWLGALRGMVAPVQLPLACRACMVMIVLSFKSLKAKSSP